MSFVNKLLLRLFSKKIGEDHFGNEYRVSCSKSHLGNIKLLSKVAPDKEMQGIYGTQNRSVVNLHEDSSTGMTKQLPSGVEFGKKSIKRFVIYKGKDLSSKVPPMWHAWLHYLADEAPTGIVEKRMNWEKEYRPNLTGTKYAYDPSKLSDKSPVYSKWDPK